MNIRYSEIFYSFQGEAEMTGQPSVWLRLFGCNLNCNGFGQKDPTDPSTYVLPYQDFDPAGITRNEDLPVWTTGCDSSYSWSQKFRHLAHNESAETVAQLLVNELKHPSNPFGLFRHPITGQNTMLSFTGGEPLLHQKALVAVYNALVDRGVGQFSPTDRPRIINIETNGTQAIREDLRREMNSKTVHGVRWHLSISPKLYTVSGEWDAVNHDNIADMVSLASSAVLKFVCNGTPECWEDLDNAVRHIRNACISTHVDMPAVWVMPVGATKDEQEKQWVQDLNIEAMKRGYYVANRLQCFVFGNVIGK